jgi:hypothetical protein
MEPKQCHGSERSQHAAELSSHQDRQSVFEAHREMQNIYPKDEFRVSPREPEKKLRVAFISPDSRYHSVAFFLKPLLKNLDPARVQILLYHCHHSEDSTSAQLRHVASKWVNINSLSDDSAARADSERRAGYCDRSCRSLRDEPPAASFQGIGSCPDFLPRLPNTTGLPAMTHRFVDEITDPIGDADAYAAGSLLRFHHVLGLMRPPTMRHCPRCARQIVRSLWFFQQFSESHR